MHSNGEKVHLRDKNFDSGRMHTWIIKFFRNRVVSSCLISFSAFKAGPIPHELQVRYQTCRDTLWSMWSILTVSIFFSWKVWLKLMYSCGIQFGLADKSLQMHPLFSQWHMKKDLNTEHSVTWERALGYWLSFLSRIVVHLLSVPGLFAFVSVAHAGHVTREKLETGRNCGQ